MALTPNNVVFGARAGLVALATADAFLPHGALSPGLVALAIGYFGALASLLAFPRVRRGDVIAALAAGITLRACMPAFATDAIDVTAWLGGSIGITLAIAPQTVAQARRLAASNAHMPFAEWRTLAHRRRRSDRRADAPAVARRLHGAIVQQR